MLSADKHTDTHTQVHTLLLFCITKMRTITDAQVHTKKRSNNRSDLCMCVCHTFVDADQGKSWTEKAHDACLAMGSGEILNQKMGEMRTRAPPRTGSFNVLKRGNCTEAADKLHSYETIT